MNMDLKMNILFLWIMEIYYFFEGFFLFGFKGNDFEIFLCLIVENFRKIILEELELYRFLG